MATTETCGLCERDCPLDALSCGRGRAAYGSVNQAEPFGGRDRDDAEQIGNGHYGHRGRHHGHGEGHRPQEGSRSASLVTDSENALVKLLVEAGNAAYHKSMHIRQAGKDDAVMFDVIDPEDREQLQRLLELLTEGWQKAHAKHSQEADRG